MRQPKKAPKSRQGGNRKAGPSIFSIATSRLPRSHPDKGKARALDAYLERGTVSAGCIAAGISRSTWYRWIKDDEEFAALAREAEEAVTDALEEEATRRAIAGSDTLLIFLLKANRRDKYGDRHVITKISPDVVERVDGTVKLIASRPSWDAQALLHALDDVWR